jgi:hypothetical protein
MSEITHFDIWLITRLDNIAGSAFVLSWVGILTSIAIVAFAALATEGSHADNKNELLVKILRRMYFRPTIALTIISIILRIFIPTTNEAFAIFVLPPVINHERTGRITKKSLDTIEEILDLAKSKIAEQKKHQQPTNREDSNK